MKRDLISTVYDLSSEMKELNKLFLDNDGEITPDLEEAFTAYCSNKTNLNNVIQELRTLYNHHLANIQEQEELKGLIDRKIKKFQNSNNYYEKMIRFVISSAGTKTWTKKGLPTYLYETDVVRFTLSPSIKTNITDVEKLEDEYVNRKIEISNLDKETYEKIFNLLDENKLSTGLKLTKTGKCTEIKEHLESYFIKGVQSNQSQEEYDNFKGAELDLNYSLKMK